jgi:hypothetical protein
VRWFVGGLLRSKPWSRVDYPGLAWVAAVVWLLVVVSPRVGTQCAFTGVFVVVVTTTRRAGGLGVVCVFGPIALISIEISAIEGWGFGDSTRCEWSRTKRGWFKRFVWVGVRNKRSAKARSRTTMN